MPEFYRKRGVVGRIRGREKNHKKVHAHFIYAEYELSVFIDEDSAMIAEGRMPSNKRRQIVRDLESNELRKKALDMWDDFHEDE